VERGLRELGERSEDQPANEIRERETV